MGMFDKVKKIGKKIVKGAKKVFKKVMKVVGKVLNSKIGKVLMIAATVVTAGAALYGAYAGMSGAFAASQAAGQGFAQSFTAGFKGALAGLKSGFAAGNKALSSAAKLDFGGAKGALMGVGEGAKAAGAGVVQGLTKAATPQAAGGPFADLGPAKDIQPPVNALGGPGGAGTPAKGTVGGLLEKGSGQTWSSISGAENPASGVVNLANSNGSEMVQASLDAAKTAGTSSTDKLLAQMMESQAKSNNRLLWGNILSQGAQAYGNYNSAQAAADAEEDALRRGWARDASFDPMAYV